MHKKSTVNSVQILAVDASDFAKLVGVSLRHIRRMESAGMIGPRPLRFGRSVRYSLLEVQKWIKAGAPARVLWEQLEQGADG